ncbi:hypothetical protein TNCV_2531781 [Trichonephila clavipes]|nr:hypothetical protein TNCV_2531781 [Trichonephila clavipes]
MICFDNAVVSFLGWAALISSVGLYPERLSALHTEEKFNGFQSAFRRDSSSKPQTDESRLVRDEDCRLDVVGAPNQELQNGFALPSRSHPTTERHI